MFVCFCSRRLVGDVLLCTGFLSYSGPFNQEFRDMLMSKWQKDMKSRKIPFTANLNVTAMLVDAATVSSFVHFLFVFVFAGARCENEVYAHVPESVQIAWHIHSDIDRLLIFNCWTLFTHSIRSWFGFQALMKIFVQERTVEIDVGRQCGCHYVMWKTPLPVDWDMLKKGGLRFDITGHMTFMII